MALVRQDECCVEAGVNFCEPTVFDTTDGVSGHDHVHQTIQSHDLFPLIFCAYGSLCI